MSYLCFSLLAARHWYGKWRIEEAEKRAGVRPWSQDEQEWPDGKIAAMATLTGLFWWATGPAFGVRWLIMSQPPLAPHEIKAEKARLKSELAELERENEELRRGQEGT